MNVDSNRETVDFAQLARDMEGADDGTTPDGEYKVEIIDVYAGKTKGEFPKDKIVFELMVFAGIYTRRKLFKNFIMTPNSWKFYLRETKAIGLDMSDIENLPSVFQDIINLRLTILIKLGKNDGGYEEIKFLKRITAPVEVAEEDSDDVDCAWGVAHEDSAKEETATDEEPNEDEEVV